MNCQLAIKIIKQVKSLTNEHCTIAHTVAIYSHTDIKNEIQLYIATITLHTQDSCTLLIKPTLKAIDTFLCDKLTGYKTILKK